MSYSIRLLSINRSTLAAFGALILVLSFWPHAAFAARAVTDYPVRSTTAERTFIVEVPRGQARANDLQSHVAGFHVAAGAFGWALGERRLKHTHGQPGASALRLILSAATPSRPVPCG